jgi:hypothetical protein
VILDPFCGAGGTPNGVNRALSGQKAGFATAHQNQVGHFDAPVKRTHQERLKAIKWRLSTVKASLLENFDDQEE